MAIKRQNYLSSRIKVVQFTVERGFENSPLMGNTGASGQYLPFPEPEATRSNQYSTQSEGSSNWAIFE